MSDPFPLIQPKEIPDCPIHGKEHMMSGESFAAPLWFSCTAPGPGGVCGKSAHAEPLDPHAPPNRGWPTTAHAEGTSSMPAMSRHIGPIVSMAKFAVRCLICGYAHDTNAPTAELAVKHVSGMHEPTHGKYVAVPYPVDK